MEADGCYTGVELEGVNTNCRKAKPAYFDERVRKPVLDYLDRITSTEISNSTPIIELSHDKFIIGIVITCPK
jgi:hypothetical protein